MDNATSPDWTIPPPAVVLQLLTINRKFAILHTLGGLEIKIWFYGPGQSIEERKHSSKLEPSLYLSHLTTVALMARTAMKHLACKADTADNAEYVRQMAISSFRVLKDQQELAPGQGLIELIGLECTEVSLEARDLQVTRPTVRPNCF